MCRSFCKNQDMARGSLGTVREGLKRARENLSAKEYRDIDNRHRKQLIELKTTEMAASDLDKYHKVGPLLEKRQMCMVLTHFQWSSRHQMTSGCGTLLPVYAKHGCMKTGYARSLRRQNMPKMGQ